jgi:DNA (cytosine-5)-methyltransferase 1
VSGIVDLFAGPGGWSEGLRLLGLSDIGIEVDASACDTRRAAGHATIRADVTTIDPRRFKGFTGVIASPPCTDWSAAGGRAGRSGKTGHLVDLPLAWVEAIRPEWVACEQVPEVLPIWQEHALRYRELGYSTWTGILCAADYGVPQTRRRAILMASRVGPALPPDPTHGQDPEPGLFGTLEPWVTMAEALGWGYEDCPSNTLVTRASGGGDKGSLLDGGSGARRKISRARESGAEPSPTIAFGHDAASWCWVLDRRQQNPDGSPVPPVPPDRPAPTLTGQSGQQWVFTRPATTVLGAPGHRDREGGEAQFGEGAVKLTEAEALILQSFREDYPLQGNKTQRYQQVGNAVPPLLSAHIISALTSRALERAA